MSWRSDSHLSMFSLEGPHLESWAQRTLDLERDLKGDLRPVCLCTGGKIEAHREEVTCLRS